MKEQNTSEGNSDKLDRLLLLVEGDDNIPGITGRLGVIERILFGKENVGGMLQQHVIMWRAHVWVLCSGSAAFGAVLTLIVQQVLKLLKLV